MKKWVNKQTVIAFILGALIFAGVPVSAAIVEYICYKADYKVMVNGEQYINDDLPILNYKGNTYAPFRSVLEAAGLNVNWNTELKQAEVTAPAAAMPSTSISNEDVIVPPAELPPEDAKIEQEPELEKEDPPVTPQGNPTSEYNSETTATNHIGEVLVIMDGDRKIVVYYPELMDIVSAMDLSNYKVYEADGTTVTSVQPKSAEYLNTGGGIGVCRIVLHIDELPLGIVKYSDDRDRFCLWISPAVKNADGSKQVNNLDDNSYLTNGKILFAYPYTEKRYPDGTTTIVRGSD